MRDNVCRRWPIGQYVNLARLLISSGFMVAITGAASDRWVEPYFSKMPIVDFIGKTSLIDTLNIYSQADLVVTHDSGPLHLAILVRSTVLGIFGPTVPCEKIPYSSNIHILWNKNSLPCCPCYDGKNYANCEYNQCLQEITAEYVLERVMEIESEYEK
jgi:heptosyltransferase-2